MNKNNKLEYPNYCDEDVRCDELFEGAGCPYLNEDGECNIANAMAYREYKESKLVKEKK